MMLGADLKVFTFWFHNICTLVARLVATNFGTCLYQCLVSNFTPVSLHMLKCFEHRRYHTF
jgi:hypothetical protein